jgi:hypothetical protein
LRPEQPPLTRYFCQNRLGAIGRLKKLSAVARQLEVLQFRKRLLWVNLHDRARTGNQRKGYSAEWGSGESEAEGQEHQCLLHG